jgi:two-component system, OmpR family, sensor kinase
MEDRNTGISEGGKDRLIEELREAVRARDEFVAIAAHELRNPMTPILMQVGLLLAAAKSPNRCRPEVITPRLELLEMAITEFVRRSTALLDVSRIAAGNVRIEVAEVNLSALIRGVVSRMAVAARRARCRLNEELQEGVVGMWDPLALEQVAENLLTNATKFGAGYPIAVVLPSWRFLSSPRSASSNSAPKSRCKTLLERQIIRSQTGFRAHRSRRRSG